MAELTVHVRLLKHNLNPMKEKDYGGLLHFDNQIKGAAVTFPLVNSGVKTKLVGQPFKGKHFPIDSYICLQAYTNVRNEKGQNCLSEAGRTTFLLSDIYRHFQSTGADFCSTRPLCMPEDKDYTKGVVEIRISKEGMQPNGYSISSEIKPSDALVANKETYEWEATKYVKGDMHFVELVPTASESEERILAPLYPGPTVIPGSSRSYESALQMKLGSPMARDGMLPEFFPGIAYLIGEPRVVTTENYWKQCLKIICERRGVMPKDVLRMPYPEQARIMAKMITLFPELCPYLADQVDEVIPGGSYQSTVKKAIEKFGDSCRTKSADCEDGSCAIHQLFRSFQDNKEIKHDSPLHCLQKVANDYVPLSCLYGVTATDVSKIKDGITPQIMGAHMGVMLIPRQYFKTCLLGFNLCTHSAKERPTLVLEGTGEFDPLGGEVEDDNELAYILGKHPVMNTCKYKIVHDRSKGASKFYKRVEKIFTDENIRAPVYEGAKNIATIYPSRCDVMGRPLHRGVSFMSIINQSRDIRFKSIGPMSDRLIEMCVNGCKSRPKPIVFDYSPSVEVKEKLPPYYNMFKMVQSTVSGRPDMDGKPTIPIRFNLRYNCLTDSIAEGIRKCLYDLKASGRAASIKVETENYMNNSKGYRLNTTERKLDRSAMGGYRFIIYMYPVTTDDLLTEL